MAREWPSTGSDHRGALKTLVSCPSSPHDVIVGAGERTPRRADIAVRRKHPPRVGAIHCHPPASEIQSGARWGSAALRRCWSVRLDSHILQHRDDSPKNRSSGASHVSPRSGARCIRFHVDRITRGYCDYRSGCRIAYRNGGPAMTSRLNTHSKSFGFVTHSSELTISSPMRRSRIRCRVGAGIAPDAPHGPVRD